MRKRLSKNIMSADAKDKYPGTVNQPERQFKTQEQYDNYKETLNHPTPDMRDDWKDNKRNEIGMGVPKIAHIYATAQQATRLATLFLGDKVEDNAIEAQARDFMRLGSKRIQASLSRFNASESLYAEDEAVNEGCEIQPVSAEQNQAQKVADECVDCDEEVIAEETEEVAAEETEEVVAEETEEVVAEETEVAAEEIEEVVAEETEEVVAEETEEVVAEETEVAAEETEEVADFEVGDGIDCQLSEELDYDLEEEAGLEQLFESDDLFEEDNSEVVIEAKINKKAGIKSLGGVAKIASVSNSDDLSTCWSDAPDVSSIFN